jgi:hypothetical protein
VSEIKDQRIYLGPRLHAFGIGYGNVFYNQLHPRLEEVIAKCPAIAGLLVPVEQCGVVRRELHFDYAHNMRGTRGKYVTFYREIQNWLKSQSRKTKQTPTIEVKHHHA